MERAQTQRCWKGVGDGEACQGSETVELERAGDSRAGKDLKTVELDRARRRYRAGPGLEYGGAGQSSEKAELFRGSEMAKLAGARRRRNLLGLGDSGAGKGSKMPEAGQGSETVELVCDPETTELTSDQGSETVEMARLVTKAQKRWRWPELGDGGAGPSSRTA